MSLLEAKGLKKYFKSGEIVTKAVDNISISIEKGEFVTIVGASGSGKTSLLNLLGGLDEPDDGEVFLNGKNMTKMTDEQRTIFRRRNTGFIFQDYNLIPIMNVRENIVLPIEMDGQKVDEEFFNKIIDIIGIQKKLSNMPNQLSGGERQRVAIARAILLKPQIIFADEPTGNLDTESADNVMSLLKISNEAFNQSILLITHNPLLAQLSDRIIRIEDGKIREDIHV